MLDDDRAGFYGDVLRRLLDEGALRRDMSVVVSCGGESDRDVLAGVGFENVTITNLDSSGDDQRYAPFAWQRQDAEQLDIADDAFDLGLVSAGLHHCHSPHRALLELYRVSRVATIGFEARDSLLMRAAVRFGLSDDYEVSAVAHQGLRAGGVGNSPTPNFVYRWTEREVEKTIASFAPEARPNIRYFHQLELPQSLLELDQSSLRGRVARVAGPALEALVRVAPKQANLLAFAVFKPRLPADLQPWMALVDGEPRPDAAVIGQRYKIGPD